MYEVSWVAWLAFNAFVLLMLGLDLGVFHRKSHAVGFKEALLWSGVWVGLALLFFVGVYHWMGPQSGMEFLTGYVIEKSLSVDNLFLFLTIFNSFRVPAPYQHKVLFWGILGALVMRAAFIFSGIELIHRFHWLVYVFGVFLLLTACRMLVRKKGVPNLEKNLAFRAVKRFFPTTSEYHGADFFAVKRGRRYATPLFVVLILIESMDLVFAIDSIPAILAVTDNAFIVYTSNVFAILGLRALYFALAGFARLFYYLHHGLALILAFVGTKMILTDIFNIPIWMSLLIILSILTIAMGASLLWPKEVPDREIPNREIPNDPVDKPRESEESHPKKG